MLLTELCRQFKEDAFVHQGRSGRVGTGTNKQIQVYSRGVNNYFKTLAKLVSSSELLLAKSGNNWPKI
jgi:hypothetical protein